MPTNRTRRARVSDVELDQFKRQAMFQGPEAVLIAGEGYYPNTARSDLRTEAEHDAAIAAMRVDWDRHGAALMHWWNTAVPLPKAERDGSYVPPGGPDTKPWAWHRFGKPAGA